MLKNYLKIAFRSLFNQKGYSIINIAGLSISLAVTLLMLLWVLDEWGTDKFHTNKERLHYVFRTIPLEGGKLDVYRGVPLPLMRAAESELPGVEKYIPIRESNEETIGIEQNTFRATGSVGTLSLFEAFSFPVLAGDVSQLDKKSDAIAISESLAKKLFGNVWQSVALGETVQIHDQGDFSIEAVYEDFPENSTLKQEFVYSLQHFIDHNDWILDWGNSGMRGVLLLAENADAKTIEQQVDKIFKDKQAGGTFIEGCFLQKFSDNYLFNQFDDQAKVAGGRIEYVQLFGLAALLLLIIACINFVNLATARASKRAKEVGVRKTIGAGQQSLVIQFLTEATCITLISVGMAIFLSETLVPHVQLITGKLLDFDYSQPIFWAGISTVVILTSLLSGIYPALILSSFKPINVLKGKIKEQTSSISFRKGLVIAQFVLALLLIVAALVVQQQVEYIQNKNLGLNKENLLVINQDAQVSEKYEALKNELLAKQTIKGVTTAGPNPVNISASTGGVSWEGKTVEQGHLEFNILWAAGNFPSVFEIPMAAGRYYKEDGINDTINIVLNEKAVEIMGFDQPIGKTITWWGQKRQIIGIVKDFHNTSLYNEIKPTGFLLDPLDAGALYVRTEAGKTQQAIADLQSAFAKVVPEVPLHFEFVGEQIQSTYKSEVLTEKLATYFAIISIFISCLGLLGLATFLAEQKTKEIGIRKVLGASILNLMGLLSKDFLVLVGMGLLIGIPVSWYLLNSWLTNFAYTIDLQWWMFAIPVVAAILIAGLTVCIQAIRAAITNPVQALRSE